MPRSKRKGKWGEGRDYESCDVSNGSNTSDVSSRKKATSSRAISCEPCRKRKLKCDRVRPCSSCVSRHEEDQCTWEEGTRPLSSSLQLDSADVLERIEALESSIQSLNSFLRETAQSASSNERKGTFLSERAGGVNLEKLRNIHDEKQTVSLSFHTSDIHRTRELLLMIHALLPTVQVMKDLVSTFLANVDCLDDVVGSCLAHHHLHHVIRFKDMLSEHADTIFRYDQEQLHQCMYSCSLCLIMFASASAYSHSLIRHVNNKSHLIDYINISLNGLASLNIYQAPDPTFVLIVALLLTNFMYALRPLTAAELLFQAMNVSALLGLNQEPPEQMEYDKAKRHVRWFALLCASDWDLMSIMERHPIINVDKERFPSIFGTDQNRSRYLPKSILCRLLCARLSFRTATLSRSLNRTKSNTEELHKDILDAMAIFQGVLNASTPDNENSPHIVRSKFGIASLHYLLIHLHVPYYVRGWNNDEFSLSKNTCFESALFLLHLFRDIFQCSLSTKDDDKSEGSLSRMANHFQFASRWCCVAALLLVTHLTMAHEREFPKPADPNQKFIVEDLCTLSKILHFLSPVSVSAREGYTALQRASMHVMKTTNSLLQTDGENGILLWAKRLNDPQTEMQDSSSSEPISLLTNVMTGKSSLSSLMADPKSSQHQENNTDHYPILSVGPPSGQDGGTSNEITLWDHFGASVASDDVSTPLPGYLWDTFQEDWDPMGQLPLNDYDLDKFISSLLPPVDP